MATKETLCNFQLAVILVNFQGPLLWKVEDSSARLLMLAEFITF